MLRTFLLENPSLFLKIWRELAHTDAILERTIDLRSYGEPISIVFKACTNRVSGCKNIDDDACSAGFRGSHA